MGIKLFGSSDSRDDGKVIRHFSSDTRDEKIRVVTEEKVVRLNSTPDPKKFKILEKEFINGYPILVVQYPDVTNYEGKKILMYRKNFDLNLIKDRIDPHFFTEGDSPIARFEPTEYGLYLATTLASNLM